MIDNFLYVWIQKIVILTLNDNWNPKTTQLDSVCIVVIGFICLKTFEVIFV